MNMQLAWLTRIFRWRAFLLVGLVCLTVTGCGSSVTPTHQTANPSQVTSPAPSRQVESPPPAAQVPTSLPSSTPSLAPSASPQPLPACLREGLPAQFAETPVVRGWKTFTSDHAIKVRYLYFPPDCPVSKLDEDGRLLLFGNLLKDEELGLLVLHPVNEGLLAPLYKHLAFYDFWAMGPEDYPVLLKVEQGFRNNIVILRSERLTGDGTPGSTDAQRMVGLAEHEYIHTVQGRNNPKLASMIWSNETYRAFIERYANIGNNATARYFRAAPSILALLQFLDGLNQQNQLEPKVNEILKARGGSLDAFLKDSYPSYSQHVRTFLTSVSSKKYLDQVSAGKVSPLYLVERAGSGKLDGYDLLRQLYNENIRQYNRWFYGGGTGGLPVSFDDLFSTNYTGGG